MSTRPREASSLRPIGAEESHQTQKASGPFYIRTPLRILHEDRLSALEKLLFAVLILHWGAEGKCNPSHGRLADELGTTRRTILTMLAHLRALGEIEWRRGQYGSSYYFPKLGRGCGPDSYTGWAVPGANSSTHLTDPDVKPTSHLTDSRCEVSSIQMCNFACPDVKPTSHKKKLKEEVKEPPPPNPPEQCAGGGGETRFSEADEQAFRRIESTAKIPTDGILRSKLAASLKAQGSTVQHLAAWLNEGRLKGATNVAGLLLTMAKQFETRSSGYVWPSCLRCNDTAMADGTPCACEAGQLKAAGLARKAEEKRLKDESVQKCRREAEEREAVEMARAQPFKDQGICPKCEGKAPGCDQCNGTLIWRSLDAWRELGICSWCKGVRTLWGKSQPCMGCAGRGTNRMKTPTDHRIVACA